MTSNSAVRSVRERILNVLKTDGNIVEPIADEICTLGRSTLSTSGKDGTSYADSLENVIDSVMEAAVDSGGDTGKAVKGMVLGILRANRLPEHEMRDVIADVSNFIIRDAIRYGGDLEKTAKALLEGTIEGAKEHGWDTVRSAGIAAASAVQSAYHTGEAPGELVRETLTGNISGIYLSP